ncbi:MAG: MATE family efflux transporter [Lachnospiraceae bacterium]
MSEKQTAHGTLLSSAPVGRLLLRFAVPSVISLLVGALYNIIDQIFIGRSVGPLGNAATNVAFPITTITLSIALLFGIGGAARFNLCLGTKDSASARRYAANSFLGSFCVGVVLMILILLFSQPLVRFLGATDEIMGYSLTFVRITALGIPFFMITTSGNHLIRADGSPGYSMLCILSGAVINTILNPILIFKFNMGVTGSAIATVIGQVISAILIIFYLTKYKSVSLKPEDFVPRALILRNTISLGAAACFNQLALAVVQIVMNNLLVYYGEASVYGSSTALAVVGVISKINVIFISLVIGISQGAQPIISYNYGAKNYERAKKAYLCALGAATGVAVLAFICFQLFPRQITALFGEGDDLYFQFATEYFRIFLFCTFMNSIQPVTANFFTSIGKATRGIFISLTRQIIFLLPLIVILPRFLGIDGIMYAGPVADIFSAAAAIIFILYEFRSHTYWQPAKESEARC